MCYFYLEFRGVAQFRTSSSSGPAPERARTQVGKDRDSNFSIVTFSIVDSNFMVIWMFEKRIMDEILHSTGRRVESILPSRINSSQADCGLCLVLTPQHAVALSCSGESTAIPRWTSKRKRISVTKVLGIRICRAGMVMRRLRRALRPTIVSHTTATIVIRIVEFPMTYSVFLLRKKRKSLFTCQMPTADSSI